MWYVGYFSVCEIIHNLAEYPFFAKKNMESDMLTFY